MKAEVDISARKVRANHSVRNGSNGKQAVAGGEFLRTQRMEELGTLASGIAHDLNNIISPVLMGAQVLRTLSLPADAARIVAIIEASAERAAGVVRQVLSFASDAEGSLGTLQPRKLLEEIGVIIRETFPRNLSLRIDIAGELWPITGNSTQLHQVLLNLCVNARDAMPSGGLLILSAENTELDEAFVRKHPEARVGPYVAFGVEDTGEGIPPSILERIFEPFFSSKPKDRGTGLGLSTARSIARSHGGLITVWSTVGRGSVFRVFLPAAAVKAREPGVAEVADECRGDGQRILLVDDEDGVRDLVQSILVRSGYHVDVATDGAEAIALFSRAGAPYDLIVTDLIMPIMDGVALARAARSLSPDIRVLLMSGMENALQGQNRLENRRSLGLRCFLRKPFSTDRLLNSVREALAPNDTDGSAGFPPDGGRPDAATV